ncbi:hypothetical protein ANO11243_053770 [Dothideomycetidae sp. 11243]|nr:hypothetical protein ANO11243_053770 [fungal sp. No.11243]
MEEARSDAFTQLKPPCVALNQAILSFLGRSAPPDLAVQRAEDLLRTLQKFDDSQLNARLAEYVFIPISYILKSSQQLPIRASEAAFESLALLLRFGWREQVAGPLGIQLLILLAITADQFKKGANSRKPTPELLKAVFDCLRQLFFYLAETKNGKSQLIVTSAAPHLGHAVTVILDGVVSGDGSNSPNSAASALKAMIRAVDDHETVASFLPGIVSGLTKVLTPSTQARRTWTLLALCLETIDELFRKAVSDRATAHFKTSTSPSSAESSKGLWKLDSSWLEATAGQLKLALANIHRQRTHDRIEVRRALAMLDLTILRDCAESLSNCQQMCIENTLLLLDDEHFEDLKGSVVTLMRTNQKVSESLETTLRDWTVSLPRILEASDDDKKRRRIQQMFTAYHLLQDGAVVSHSLKQLVSSNLPDYLAIILRTVGQDMTAVAQRPAVRLENLPVALRSDRTTSFPDALSSSRFQSEILDQIQGYMQYVITPELALSLTSQTRQATQDMQISTIWLSLKLIGTSSPSPVDDLLNLDSDESWREELLDDLYDFSLTTIANDDADWRLQALSLEAIAMQATALGQAFRNELIDALYPVLFLLGGDTPRLRQHAIVCLNIITNACGFKDVKELIVANADYLVNAVALRLNSFDVSPQGPQALLMMVKLAGPNLIPYLEDTVESIFAVLEDYHGYTTLVELLFSVLNAIGEQGVQEARLQIEAPTSMNTYPSLEWHPITVNDLRNHIRDRQKASIEDDQATRLSETAPQEPWKSTNTEPDTTSHDEEAPTEDASAPVGPPTGKTYPLLLRIAQQTQYHLPSSSSSLRILLLIQLQTLLPALAKHEDSFLPLINTIWPEIIARVADNEAPVTAAALDTAFAICQLAGGFMKSRIRDIWPDMRRLHGRVAASVAGRAEPITRHGKTASPEPRLSSALDRHFVDKSAVALRSAFQAFVVACVTHAKPPPRTRKLSITQRREPIRRPTHPSHDLSNMSSIHIRPSLEHIPPHSSSKHRIPLYKSLIITNLRSAPLLKQIFQILRPHAAHAQVMQGTHLLLGGVEEMIQQVLRPPSCMCLGEHPDP